MKIRAYHFFLGRVRGSCNASTIRHLPFIHWWRGGDPIVDALTGKSSAGESALQAGVSPWSQLTHPGRSGFVACSQGAGDDLCAES